jgi:hypothetical protein
VTEAEVGAELTGAICSNVDNGQLLYVFFILKGNSTIFYGHYTKRLIIVISMVEQKRAASMILSLNNFVKSRGYILFHWLKVTTMNAIRYNYLL